MTNRTDRRESYAEVDEAISSDHPICSSEQGRAWIRIIILLAAELIIQLDVCLFVCLYGRLFVFLSVCRKERTAWSKHPSTSIVFDHIAFADTSSSSRTQWPRLQPVSICTTVSTPFLHLHLYSILLKRRHVNLIVIVISSNCIAPVSNAESANRRRTKKRSRN